MERYILKNDEFAIALKELGDKNYHWASGQIVGTQQTITDRPLKEGSMAILTVDHDEKAVRIFPAEIYSYKTSQADLKKVQDVVGNCKTFDDLVSNLGAERQNYVLSVYPENLGKYNEGQILGDWIDLPTSEKRIHDFLKDVVGLNEDYEEYFIADYDIPEEYSFIPKNEHCDLYDLNLLATQLNGMHPKSIESIELYSLRETNLSIKDLLNITLQIHNISYGAYSFDGMEYCSNLSNEELFGRTVAEAYGLTDELERKNVEQYFDFEAYGKDTALNEDVELGENGYIDMRSSKVDLNLFSMEEIRMMIKPPVSAKEAMLNDLKKIQESMEKGIRQRASSAKEKQEQQRESGKIVQKDIER